MTARERIRTDRGTTLVEVVVALFLVAMAAGLLAQLMASTARSAPSDRVEPDLTLAADTFARDAREAVSVEAETRRGALVAITFVSDTAMVRWVLVGDELTRDDGTSPRARTMAGELDDASRFGLRDAQGDAVDPDDGDAVRWCTRLVDVALVTDDSATARSTALRVEPDAAACP